MSMEDNIADADADRVDRPATGLESASQLWTMKDGRKIRIGDMSDRHLLNSIRMLERVAKTMEERAINAGYAILCGMQGEMAIQSIESDLRQLEEEGEDPERIFPIYEHLLNVASDRGIL